MEEVIVKIEENVTDVTILVNSGYIVAVANHSDLILDDGTNPHNTNKNDVGLGNVPNYDFTAEVNINNAKISFPEAPNDNYRYLRGNNQWTSENRHVDLGTISGATLNLDLTAGETFTATITENTTIAFVNPIAKVVTLDLTGDFSITFPAGTTIVGDSYDGNVVNKIAIEYKSATDIFVSITNR